MKKKLAVVCVTIFLCGRGIAQEKIDYNLCGQDFRAINMRDNLPDNAVYINRNAPPEARAKDVISRLTFDEKLMLTGGWKQMHFPAVERLGLPPVYFSDASQGIHIKDLCVKVGKSTAFPATIALAATWNPELAYAYAKSISEECRAWGISVLLGPGMNMYRNAEGGRNFEYLGEDPFLTSKLSVSYVKGLQDAGAIATIKHFIGNEQEFARHIANIKIGERALREIYLPPFEASIKDGKALAVMTGNNVVNGYPGAANKPLTNDILRKEYGFKGAVMSDWANSTFWPEQQNIELTSGHSLLMDNNEVFANYVRKEIKDHPERKQDIEKDVDAMVFYNLYTFFKGGIYDRSYRDPALLSTFDAHKKVALQTAEEGITLLKNNNHILPIKPASVKKIVVLGTDEALKVYTGKGSGMVQGYEHVDYLTGLKNVYGNKIVYKKDISEREISSADVVLYFITRPSGEGFDVDFNLPDVRDSVNK
ncbi:MAG: glycoside hydrolase family 3 N-terminal domain-containing protein, partial [Segetibacter sp.]